MDRLEERGSEHSGSGTSAGVWQPSRSPLEWVNQAALDRHFDRLALEERSRQAGLFEVHAVSSLADRVADTAGCRALNPKPLCWKLFGGLWRRWRVNGRAYAGGFQSHCWLLWNGCTGTPYYRPP